MNRIYRALMFALPAAFLGMPPEALAQRAQETCLAKSRGLSEYELCMESTLGETARFLLGHGLMCSPDTCVIAIRCDWKGCFDKGYEIEFGYPRPEQLDAGMDGRSRTMMIKDPQGRYSDYYRLTDSPVYQPWEGATPSLRNASIYFVGLNPDSHPEFAVLEFDREVNEPPAMSSPQPPATASHTSPASPE